MRVFSLLILQLAVRGAHACVQVLILQLVVRGAHVCVQFIDFATGCTRGTCVCSVY
jgi:hypothetical protein